MTAVYAGGKESVGEPEQGAQDVEMPEGEVMPRSQHGDDADDDRARDIGNEHHCEAR